MPNVIAIPILAGIFVFGLILGAIIRKGSVGYWRGAILSWLITTPFVFAFLVATSPPSDSVVAASAILFGVGLPPFCFGYWISYWYKGIPERHGYSYPTPLRKTRINVLGRRMPNPCCVKRLR